MNILFVSIDGDPTYVGGTATIVQLMAKWLRDNGHFCALGYFQKGEYPTTFFEEKILLSLDNEAFMNEFNDKHEFDLLYLTQCIGIDWALLRRCFPKAKFIAAYHSRPMLMCPTRRSLSIYLHGNFTLSSKLKVSLYWLLYPLYRKHKQTEEREAFNRLAANCDALQLLSKGFIPNFLKIVPSFSEKRIFCIGNPVVWNTGIEINDIARKEHNVLVVCNANHPKRAHLMIEIWRRIEEDVRFNNWTFTFVGDSIEVQILKRKALYKYHLQRINFVGRQNPFEYYRKARVFLMTSSFEGWPMVLMEAMQMGVVPIAFNSFESVYDIIDDHLNGIIVENNDIDMYVKQLKWLMWHEEECMKMGEAATYIADRYSIEKVMKQYVIQFNKLLSHD